jgi:hypothetical protein
VNLVEMDLLRSGKRPPVDKPLPPADYYIIVSRAVDFPHVGVWPLSVRDSLPTVPFPLGSAEEPVFLPLRPSMDRAFDEAGYVEEIDYSQPPTPPLNDADAAWAAELLAHRAN